MTASPALDLLYQAALQRKISSVAVLNAHAHPLLSELKATAANVSLVQTFKPEIHALSAVQAPCLHLQGEYSLILLLPSKDKQQSLAWIALAFDHLQAGGTLLMACENRYGAKSYQSALHKLAGHANASSKAKCRIFSASKTADLDVGLQHIWLEDAKPRKLEAHQLWAAPGMFSWKTADVGSELLLKTLSDVLPDGLSGVGMDLCCGYGLLAVDILQKHDHIKALHLVEADANALACAKLNTLHHKHVHDHHADATRDALPKKIDWVICNPPFHRGQTRDVELGKAIVLRACHALRAGGDLYVVANRQLPYEAIFKEHLSSVATLVAKDGFKVLHGKR